MSINPADTRVCVMGLGYIGLPTASLLATKGFKVHGVDVASNIVETINQGRIHIVEPDLDILVKSAVNSGNLTASMSPEPADVFIIAVPTPLREDKSPNLSYIQQAVDAIKGLVQHGNLILLESTSPVGTTQEVVACALASEELVVGKDIFVAHCPERVLPGRILTELVENDRIVGGIDEESTERACEFYESFVRGQVLPTDARVAEMAKLAENSFRDVNIAYANELSMLCEHEGINPWDVIALANRHPRVSILNPGPGVGGHCIAVDPWFVIHRNPDLAQLTLAARKINDAKPGWVIDRVRKHAERFKRPVIGCLGLAFKADVDDLRESPALDIVRELSAQDIGELLVCEPNLSQHPDFDLVDVATVLARSDILLVLVDHRPFKRIPVAQVKEKVVIDTRGIFR